MKFRRTIAIIVLAICLASFTEIAMAGTAIPVNNSVYQYVTNADISSRLQKCLELYPAGSYFTGKFSGGKECYGFGKWVINQVFGKYRATDGTNKVRSWLYNGGSDSMSVIGSTKDYSANSVKALLSKAQPGDVLQFQNYTSNPDKGQHTMIVWSVESDGVVIYDCNWTLDNKIRKEKVGYGAWSSRKSLKLTLLRSQNFAVDMESVALLGNKIVIEAGTEVRISDYIDQYESIGSFLSFPAYADRIISVDTNGVIKALTDGYSHYTFCSKADSSNEKTIEIVVGNPQHFNFQEELLPLRVKQGTEFSYHGWCETNATIGRVDVSLTKGDKLVNSACWYPHASTNRSKIYFSEIVDDLPFMNTKNWTTGSYTYEFEYYDEDGNRLYGMNGSAIVLTSSCSHTREMIGVVLREPTCTETGEYWTYCDECHQPLKKYSDVPAAGHTLGTWVEEKKATTSSDGRMAIYCKVCGACVAEKMIPAYSMPSISLISEQVDESTGHIYRLYGNKSCNGIPWDSARVYAECLGDGWQLACMDGDSTGEQSIIENMVVSFDRACWLGANDLDGDWKWISGISISTSDSRWDSGEPSGKNSSSSEEHYLGIYANNTQTSYSTTKKWNDFSRTSATVKGFVVEFTDPTSAYFQECLNTYDTDIYVTVKESGHKLSSLPCSPDSEVGREYGSVYVSNAISAGNRLKITGIVENHAPGHYWYHVDGMGMEGWFYAPYCYGDIDHIDLDYESFTATDTGDIEANVGEPFELRGAILGPDMLGARVEIWNYTDGFYQIYEHTADLGDGVDRFELKDLDPDFRSASAAFEEGVYSPFVYVTVRRLWVTDAGNVQSGTFENSLTNFDNTLITVTDSAHPDPDITQPGNAFAAAARLFVREDNYYGDTDVWFPIYARNATGGRAWGCDFVTAVAKKMGIPTSVIPAGIAADKWAKISGMHSYWAKTTGGYSFQGAGLYDPDYIPAPGDIVTFGRDSSVFSNVGIVTYVDASNATFDWVGGNTTGTVKRYTGCPLSANQPSGAPYAVLWGFFHPDWSQVDYYTDPVPVEHVEMYEDDGVYHIFANGYRCKAGDTVQFGAYVNAEEEYDAAFCDVLLWTSSDPTVATVDKYSGVVTAVGPGVTEITASAIADGRGYSGNSVHDSHLLYVREDDPDNFDPSQVSGVSMPEGTYDISDFVWNNESAGTAVHGVISGNDLRTVSLYIGKLTSDGSYVIESASYEFEPGTLVEFDINTLAEEIDWHYGAGTYCIDVQVAYGVYPDDQYQNDWYDLEQAIFEIVDADAVGVEDFSFSQDEIVCPYTYMYKAGSSFDIRLEMEPEDATYDYVELQSDLEGVYLNYDYANDVASVYVDDPGYIVQGYTYCLSVTVHNLDGSEVTKAVPMAFYNESYSNVTSITTDKEELRVTDREDLWSEEQNSFEIELFPKDASFDSISIYTSEDRFYAYFDYSATGIKVTFDDLEEWLGSESEDYTFFITVVVNNHDGSTVSKDIPAYIDFDACMHDRGYSYGCNCLEHTSEGWPIDVYCGVCYKYLYTEYSDEPVHNYGLYDLYEASCTEDGYAVYICEACGDEMQEIIPASGHWYEIIESAEPTCTTDGYNNCICEYCGDEIQETVPATGHDYELIDRVDPTCYYEGWALFECTVCKDVYRDPIAKLDHTPVTDACVEPTCTKTGLTEGSHCSVCDAVIVAQTSIPAKGHTPVTDAAVPATCTASGLTEGSHCSVCGTTIVAQTTVKAKGHTPVTDAAVPATCTASGLTEGSHCSVCDAVIVAQTNIPAKGHTPVTDAAVPATCTASGLTEGSHCSVCDAVIVAQTSIPAKGHTPVTDAAVPATCAASGLTEGSHCSVCKEVIVAQTAVKALDHDSGTWVTVKEPTATEDGSRELQCTRCHAVLDTEVIPKTGSSEPVDTPAAKTVTAKPGEQITVKVYVNTKEAVMAKVKVDIDTNVFEYVSANGLNGCTAPTKASGSFLVGDGTQAFGSMEIGTIVLRVKDDVADGKYTIGTSIMEAFTASLGDAECKAAVDIVRVKSGLPGDVNEDNVVNTKDAIILSQYLADWDVTINLENADVNNDNKANLKDLILLKQYLADWEVELI